MRHSSFSPFRSTWERIKRAKAYSEAFAEEWNSLGDNDLCTSILHIEADGTGSVRVAPVEGAIPHELSLRLGEILYHLRAGLDNLIYDAAILDSRSDPPPNHTVLEFPLCRRRADFEERGYKIAPLSDKRKSVIEAVQPYNAPQLSSDLQVFNFNRALGILNDWARRDRHRRLSLFPLWAVRASPKLRLPTGVSLQRMKVRSWGSLGDEDVVATFRLRGFVKGMPVQANPDLSYDIAVDEAPFPVHESDNLGRRLEVMVKAVAEVATRIQRDVGPKE